MPSSSFRKKVSAWMLDHYPLILAGVFVSSLLCSGLGYFIQSRETSGAGGEEEFVGIFRAISHFTMESMDAKLPAGNLARLLAGTGRWLAILFITLSTASLLQSVFQWNERLFRHLHCRKGKTHTIVIGFGWKGRNLIANRGQGSKPCLILEATPTDKSARAAWDEGVSLVLGDATEPDALRKVRPETAEAIYICVGDDEAAMLVIQELFQFKLLPTAVICVDLRSQRHFDVLQKSVPAGVTVDLRLFNTEAITTRQLLDRHPIDRFDDPADCTGAEIIMLGESTMARELVRQIMQHGIFESDKQLVIIWLVDEPEAACECFSGYYPCFAAEMRNDQWHAVPDPVWSYGNGAKVLPEIRFTKLPPSGRGLLEAFEGTRVLLDGKWATSVYVVFDDAARSAALASQLAPALEPLRAERDLKLHYYFNTRDNSQRDAVLQSLQREVPALPIVAFSDFLGACSMSAVRGDSLDKTARRVNGIYQMDGFRAWLGNPERIRQHPDWRIPAETMDLDQLIRLDPSHQESYLLLGGFDEFCLEKWPSCPESDKESSRQAACHAPIKKRIRSRIASPFPDRDTQVLAEIEHRRWCVEYLLRGFRSLTRVPSALPPSSAGFTLAAGEVEAIGSWFGLNGRSRSKARMKSLKRHVDLVPFEDLKLLFPPEIAEMEERKDHDQIRAIDLILR